MITNISHLQTPNIEYNIGNRRIKYNYLPRGETTKILGLHISRTSWTVAQVNENINKANTVINTLYAARGMAKEDKLYLVKTLMLSILMYPCIPLNTCSISAFCKLQAVQNRALKFAFGVYYPAMPTAFSLHLRARLKPVNVVLYHRAKKTWNKLSTGIAGDLDTFNMITRIPLVNPHNGFPSSKARSELGEPPPIYTFTDGHNQIIKDYYNQM